MIDPVVRRIGRAGHHIIGERGRARVAHLIIWAFFQQRSADPLGRAAEGLPFDDHGVHHRATVFDNGVVQYFDLAGLDIDGHFAGMAGVGECAGVRFRTIAHRYLYATLIDVFGQLVEVKIPDPAYFGQGHFALATNYLAADDADLGAFALQQMRADDLHPFGEHPARRAVAPPAITIEREA